MSGTFRTERPRGLHLDCGRRACQSLNLCSVFSPAIANANWAVMAPRWCQLRMPGHTPSPGNKRPAARICRRHDAAHAQTYATQQIPEDSVISLRPPFDYACPDIHNPTDVKGFRHSPAPSARSRMPAHTSLDGTFPTIPLARKCPTNRKTIAPNTALPYAAYTIRGGPEYRNRP